MKWHYTAFLVFAILIPIEGCCAHPERPSEISCLCLRVIDGDTVVLDFNRDGREGEYEHVRLSGYDAPEIRSGSAEEKSRGRAAKKKLTGMIEGKWVRFEILGGGGYNRVAGVIYFRGRNVNQEMEAYCADQISMPHMP